MRIAFAYNLRSTSDEEQAEFDSPETISAIVRSLEAEGHDVLPVEVDGTLSHLISRLETFAPELILNVAEGARGRSREAYYPSLFDQLGYPFTGSDAYVLTLTLDKWLTKLVLSAHGIDAPPGQLFTKHDIPAIQRNEASFSVPFPAVVKPNHEGSSKGIGPDAIAKDARALKQALLRLLEKYPQGVLAERYIPGMDVTVPFVGNSTQPDLGVMTPVEWCIDPAVRPAPALLDYQLKQQGLPVLQKRCPPELPRDVLARLKSLTRQIVRILGLRDVATLDFRVTEEGRIYFLEANALPSLATTGALFASAQREGWSYQKMVASIVAAAAVRLQLVPAASKVRATKQDPIRVGFTFNLKRADAKVNGDAEAEYDSPATIESIRQAIESLGHEVVLLEANAELPARLPEAKVDVVFNIAEGLAGRNREAQVPALCELCGIPYTGSDSATLALALDKALTKRILRQHGVLTPEFQTMSTGKEKLLPHLRFPLIVKPVAEGSSKGIAQKGVVDDEQALRQVVRELIEKYRQPALIEEYITGREFTVGLLGDRRPRVLPPMEICFKDPSLSRPIYDYDVKQEWEKHVFYKCPAELSTSQLRAIERAARDTFQALDCRDVARVDMRMNAQGDVYVLEINPLPGLTPGYSDLVLISQAAGMDYRALIAEILSGGLKRLREKRREPQWSKQIVSPAVS